jgi:Protein of unknown function (DUF4238)
MTGRNQHHIPQFFLRGFGVPTSGRPKKIWLFEKGQDPCLAEIKRTASAVDFYSPPSADGSPTLDGKMTDLETPQARCVAEVRAISVGQSVDANVAAGIVAHLAPRASHIRATFEHGIKGILTGAIAAFTDTKNVERLLGLNADAPSDRFREKISKTLKDDERFAQVGLPEPVLERVAFRLAKEHFGHSFEAELPAISSALGRLMSAAESLARDAHNKALDSVIDEDVRQELLATFVWSVEAAPAAGAVLPDCVALGVRDGPASCPFMLASNDELRAVVMPVSSQKLLVGRRSGAALPDLIRVNEDAAACSHSFYVAGSNAMVLAELSRLIGRRSLAVVDEALEGALEEFLPERQSAEPLAETSAETTVTPEGGATKHTDVPGLSEPKPLKYEVSFLNCADQETAERIVAVIDYVTSQISRRMPLERLEGITFAKDYPAALRSVDRGIPGVRPAETISEEIGVGVAMTVVVVRDGMVKCRIVMVGGIAHALIGDDAGAIELALHTVVHQLALVAMTELVDRALPGVLLKPFTDQHDGWLFGSVNSALDGYVAAYESANFGGEQILAAYRELLIGALDRARTLIPKARFAYRSHGEMDTLLSVALPSARHVLEFAAKLLGHCDALAFLPFDDDGRLASALDKSGLRAWLSTFQNDLRAFRLRSGNWKSFDEFLAFNRHVERVLWQCGLFPWRDPEGRSRVEVPF